MDGARIIPSYALAAWLFVRLLGVIYCIAFISLGLQIKGLVGQRGITPASEFLKSRLRGGYRRFWKLPTLCWLNASDAVLTGLCWAGAVLSVAVVTGVCPVVMRILVWVIYLSLLTVCRAWLGYQWDVLLLETGFLSIFLGPNGWAPEFPPAGSPPRAIVWLFWWLLFRLMFSSGVVKLRSGDKAWREWTALSYHYETQPLPTRLSWYFKQWPMRFHKVSAAVVLGIELFVPFLILAPPPARYVAALVFISLMVIIQLTGNYGFFNLLGIALSLLLLDDRVLEPIMRAVFPRMQFGAHPAAVWWEWVSMGVAALVLSLSLGPMLRLLRFDLNWPRWLARWLERFESFRLVNSYGLFAVMTTERPEIIIEGSADGNQWKEYEFKWKPGEVRGKPGFVAPHQPRLDWQMWFAALGYLGNHIWVSRLLVRLLNGTPEVLALLRENPFGDEPPRYVRAVLYRYRFATVAERRQTGAWWVRERRGNYSPTMKRGDGLELLEEFE
jgi:hypothetical protein